MVRQTRLPSCLLLETVGCAVGMLPYSPIRTKIAK